MKTIEIEVNDEILATVGEDALKRYLRKQTEVYAAIPSIESLAQTIDSSTTSYDEELKKAKGKAWKAHKKERYPNLK